ncbi:MAG: IS1634 family transposase [Acidobacteriaceae bacterium]
MQPKKKRQPEEKSATAMPILKPQAAGIDIGATVIYVAVNPECDLQPVRRFDTFTDDLHRLADWLRPCNVDSVAMESTGVYWIPLFQILESRGFEVYLVNARYYQNVPGRRTDVSDCQWLRHLHSVGLLRPSFRPADQVCVLRSLLRHHDSLIQTVSAGNLEFLQQGGRRYILGTPKSMLRSFEQQLLASNWREVYPGLEVKLCPAPGGKEVFILCRSAQRQLKEQAMHQRFERRIEQKLEAMAEGCGKRKRDPLKVAQQVGRLLGKNSRAAGLFQVEVETDIRGWAHLRWSKLDDRRHWMKLSEGCSMLRSNVIDWSGEDLWHAYIQLTEAEEAFRLHKSDLVMRPVWHQKEHHVQAHILVCFLAYVLWKTLGQWWQRAALGDEPRKIFAELQEISLVDVVLPTRTGVSIRKRCVSRPIDHQAILRQRLGLQIPAHIEFAEL